ELHLSAAGALGLADLAGNPLTGSPGGGEDYVVPFVVTGAPRGTPGDPLLWQSSGHNDTPSTPQSLGPLFPHELGTGVELERVSGGPDHADTADYYSF